LTTCYWIEEVACIEDCENPNLPPIPEYWVRLDSENFTPATGRDYLKTGYYAGWRAPNSIGIATGNGLIVHAANYPWGDWINGFSTTSYVTQYSDDNGFTYSDSIDYEPWVAGTQLGGYDSGNDYWFGINYDVGTGIDFDPVETRFVTVRDTGNDEGYSPTSGSIILTAISSDAINWTVAKETGSEDYVLHMAAYDGHIWYLGNNGWAAEYGVGEDYSYIAGYSANDGASWTRTDLTPGDNVPNNSAPQDKWSAASANSTGCHFIVEVFYYDAPFWYGMVYFRPTSNTTWATQYLMWDLDAVGDLLPDGASNYGNDLLACRVNDHNLIICGTMADDWASIWIKRSTDAGVNWGSPIKLMQLNSSLPFSEAFEWRHAENMFRLVELDNGNIVCVLVYEAYYPGYESSPEIHDGSPGWVSYVMSEDQGQTWSQLTLVTPWWQSDERYYTARIRAAANGNDVVVTCTDQMQGTFDITIRPTMSPDTEYLRPPSMTLPTAPTTGWA